MVSYSNRLHALTRQFRRWAQDQRGWDDETLPLHSGSAAAQGADVFHSSGEPTKGGQAVAEGNGFLRAPGQEEDDGRGLLGGRRSDAGSLEVRGLSCADTFKLRQCDRQHTCKTTETPNICSSRDTFDVDVCRAARVSCAGLMCALGLP